MHRYEMIEGASSKFWQFEVRGSDLVVEYGRIGTAGQSTTKSFASPEAAQAAAAKLVKEKTGKGYVEAGAATAQPAKPATAKPATAKSTTTKPAKAEPAKPVEAATADEAVEPIAVAGDLPDWLTQDQLDQVAAKLSKKSKYSPREIAEAVVGSEDVGPWYKRTSKSTAVLAILFERGLIPAKLEGEVVFGVIAGAAFVRPETLKRVLLRPEFNAAAAHGVLMALGRLAPDMLDGDLPEALRPWLPVVRRQLGLSTEEISDEIALELARAFVRGSGSMPLEYVEHGVYQVGHHMSHASYRAAVEKVLGIAGDRWDGLVAQAIKTLETFRAAWRVELFYLSASQQELPGIVAGAGGTDGATVMRWLDARNDSAEELAAAARAINVGKPNWDHRDPLRHREALTVLAGERFVKAGQPIPTDLDDFLFFVDTLPPTQPNHAYARALAAWPAERVHARVKAIFAANGDGSSMLKPIQGAVALGAHPDAALIKQLLDGVNWSHQNGDTAAFIGRLGIDNLPDLLARFEARPNGTSVGGWYRAIQTMIVNHAEKTGQPFAAELDVYMAPQHCGDRTAFERALDVLPRERKEAYLVAWSKLDPFEHLRLHLASDAVLDEIIGFMFAKRAVKTVHVTYPKGVSFHAVSACLAACGPRAWPMILRHFEATNRDAKAWDLLDNMPLPAHLVPARGPAAPPPPVDEQTAAALDRLVSALADEKPEATIKLTSGAIQVATSGHDSPCGLRRAVTPGNVEVLAHYDDALEGTTAGLDALCLRLGKSPVAHWEEVPGVLDSNVIALVFGDEDAFDKLTDNDKDAIDELIEDHTAHGDAVATHKKKLVTAYVGEEATSHRLFWGLDATGQTVCLMASFQA